MPPKAKKDSGGKDFEALAALTISTSEFAALVGISQEALRLRIAAGEIPKLAHGTLNLVAAVQGFFRGELARLQAAQARADHSANSRYSVVRAKEIERRIDRQSKNLISQDEAQLAVTTVIGVATAELDVLADKLPDHRPMVEEIAARLESERARISERLASGETAK